MPKHMPSIGIFILNTGTEWGVHSANGSGGTVDMAAYGWHHIVYVRNLADANCRKFYVDNSVYIQDNTGDGLVDKLAAVRYISRKDTKTVSSVVSSILKRKK